MRRAGGLPVLARTQVRVPQQVTAEAKLSLTDPALACDWIADAETTLGPIDVLINNAGVQILGHTAQMSPE